LSDEEKIKWRKCKQCGLLQYKSHLRCLNCKGTTFDQVEAEGDCTLLTYTILRAPPMEFRNQESYAIGVVQFENGIRALGQISTQENIKTGMKLKPLYKKEKDTDYLFNNYELIKIKLEGKGPIKMAKRMVIRFRDWINSFRGETYHIVLRKIK